MLNFYNHVDLDDNYVWGYDWYDEDGDPMDTYGHGTFVAGIIAAEDNELGVINCNKHDFLSSSSIYIK